MCVYVLIYKGRCLKEKPLEFQKWLSLNVEIVDKSLPPSLPLILSTSLPPPCIVKLLNKENT